MSRLVLLWFACFAVGLPAFAQETALDREPLEYYNTGLSLFERQLYGSSQQAFDNYLNNWDGNEYRKADALYYIAAASLELFRTDALQRLLAFKQAYPQHPNAVRVEYYLGKFHYRQRDYAKAVEAFANVQLLDLSPEERKQFNLLIGHSYLKLEDYSKAKSYLAKVKDEPGSDGILASYYYGYLQYQDGNYQSAITEFEKVKADPRFSRVVPAYLARIYLQLGQYAKAEEYAKSELENQAAQPEILQTVLAEALYYQGESAEALSAYAQAKEQGATFTSTELYHYGLVLLARKEYEVAASVLGSITDIKDGDSLSASIAYHQAHAYLMTGNRLRAKNGYAYAYANSNSNSVKEQAAINYAKLAYQDNEYRAAIKTLKEIVDRNSPADLREEASALLGQILASNEDPEEALKVIESVKKRSVSLSNTYQQVAYLTAVKRIEDNQLPAAIPYLQKAEENGNDNSIKAKSYYWQAEHQYKTGNFAQAADLYKKFLFLRESANTAYYQQAWYNLGYTYYKLNQLESAVSYYKKYLELESKSAPTQRVKDAELRLADIRYLQRDYTEALRLYKTAGDNARNEDKEYALYQQATLYGLLQDQDRLLSEMEAFVKQYPNSRFTDDALYSQGETYMVQRKFTQAIAVFNKLNDNYPKNKYRRLALLSVGQALIAQNKDAAAVGLFKRIIEAYPSTAEANQAARAIENSYIDRGLTDSLNEYYTSRGATTTASRRDSALWSSVLTYIRARDCEKITSSAEKYVDAFPKGIFATDAYYQLAECAYTANRSLKAREYYDVVVNRAPNRFMERALSITAGQYYDGGKYDVALNRYQQLEDVADAQQNVVEALIGQVRSYYKMKNYQKTIAVAAKIEGIQDGAISEKDEALYYTAGSYYALNNLSRALTAYKSLASKLKNAIGAEAQYHVASILYQQEQLKDAEAAIFELRDNYPGYNYWIARGFIILSDIFLKYGNNFQAKSTLRSVIDNTENEEVKKEAQAKLDTIE